MKSVRHAAARFGTAVVPFLMATGCGGPPPSPPPEPVDAERIATLAQETSRLEGASRIIFEWTAAEQGSRFRGRGVARIETPYRARLDLFLPNGETVVKAALVEGDLRLPSGLSGALLPPPRLLWATLGVVRPGAGGALLGGEALDDGNVRIRYGYAGGEELRYLIREGRVQEAELFRSGSVTESVTLERDAGEEYPTRAVYRNLPDYRELRITRESVEQVEGYPPDIWDPRG